MNNDCKRKTQTDPTVTSFLQNDNLDERSRAMVPPYNRDWAFQLDRIIEGFYFENIRLTDG
jgi:hypothetical protein